MIYVTGSLAFDYIMDFPGKISDQIVSGKIHNISLSFLVDKLQEERGGTAGNIAYSLSLFNIKCEVLASAGKDFSSYGKFLKKNGVNTKYINIVKNDYTARAYIITDVKDNQITGFYPGALRNDHTLSLPNLDPDTDFVVVAPTNEKAMANYVNTCTKNKVPFMFDPGMQLPRLSSKDLGKGIEYARILIGNDYEVALVKKKLKIKILKPMKNQIIVTTLGEKGCKVESGNKSEYITSVKSWGVLDPTGAGDAFRAGFLAGYIHGFDLITCGRIGNLSAVYAIEKYGTTNHKFTVGEFKKRYKENYKDELRY